MVVASAVRAGHGLARTLGLADAPLRTVGLLDPRLVVLDSRALRGRRRGFRGHYAPGYVSWCPLGFNNRPVFQIGQRPLRVRPLARVDGDPATRLRCRFRASPRPRRFGDRLHGLAARSHTATGRRSSPVMRCPAAPRPRRFAWRALPARVAARRRCSPIADGQRQPLLRARQRADRASTSPGVHRPHGRLMAARTSQAAASVPPDRPLIRSERSERGSVDRPIPSGRVRSPPRAVRTLRLVWSIRAEPGFGGILSIAIGRAATYGRTDEKRRSGFANRPIRRHRRRAPCERQPPAGDRPSSRSPGRGRNTARRQPIVPAPPSARPAERSAPPSAAPPAGGHGPEANAPSRGGAVSRPAGEVSGARGAIRQFRAPSFIVHSFLYDSSR